MLDIKYIRENTESVKQRLATRGTDYSALVDKAVALDGARRALIADNEEQKARQNAKNKEIPALKKAGQDVSAVFEELKEIARRIKEDDARQAELEKELEDVLLAIPNLPNERVPVGRDDSENLEMRRSGEPTQFPFEPKAHWDIGRDLGILDPETAAKVSGARFHFYKGLGARLERAVINFFLNTHTGEHGYTEVFPPFMVNRDSMRGTGQLPKFEEDAFRVANNDYFLIPTAEVPVTNMHRGEILSADEDSYDELEKLTDDACHVLDLLGLPYRVVRLCTGDLGFSSAMTYDIEVWMPSYGRYVEISSCSDFEDYQARRAAIRYKTDPRGKAMFVHTLNGSGVAVGRTVAAILENYQQADGSVRVPEALVPYMGVDTIGPAR